MIDLQLISESIRSATLVDQGRRVRLIELLNEMIDKLKMKDEGWNCHKVAKKSGTLDDNYRRRKWNIHAAVEVECAVNFQFVAKFIHLFEHFNLEVQVVNSSEKFISNNINF